MKRRSFLVGAAGLPFASIGVAAKPKPVPLAGSHIHTPGDGRPAREVLVNGTVVDYVTYADTKAGVVRFYSHDGQSFIGDMSSDWPRQEEIHGHVVVRLAK